MTRDRFLQALDCAAGVKGASVVIRAEEAAQLAEMLRVGQTRVPTTQAEWTNEQYRTAVGMLEGFKGDHLEDRLASALTQLKALEDFRAQALGTLLALKVTLAELLVGLKAR